MVDNGSSTQIRAVFLGTAEIACPVVRLMHSDPSIDLLGVISQPDRPRGRKLELLPTPVKVQAQSLSVPVHQPEKLRHDEKVQAWLQSLNLDVMVVMAYGQILPRSILNLPKKGCLNIHTSLLPKHRGAAPIQWAIWKGDSETGVTVMKMDEGMDTGPAIATRKVPITTDTDAHQLHDWMSENGASLLVEVLPSYLRGDLIPTPQPSEGVSHARKIEKKDGRMNWEQSALEIDRQIRALSPWPGCFCQWGDQTLKVWKARVLDTGQGRPGEVIQSNTQGLCISTSQGVLQILELQKQGGKRCDWKSFLAGNALPVGAFLK